MTDMTESAALNKVAAYCSTAEHCRAEVADKLQRWGLPYDTIEHILRRLEDERYIDEERFCRAFVNDKFRFAKWGKVKIAQALQLKKVSYDVCRRCLDEIDDEEYQSVLAALLQSKRKSVHAENEFELNGKLIRFALSQGFEMEDIRRSIQLAGENEDFE